MGLMVGACLAFAVMGALFRAAMQDGLPVPLVPFARGLFTTLVMLPWLLRRGPQALATRRPGAHLGRFAAGSCSFLLTMLALLWLPLADAVAILHAKPLWALPLAFLLLGERIGWDRAIAAAIGFAGVLVIASPDLAAGGPDLPASGLAAALAGGAAGAMVLVAVKTLSTTEPPARVVAWYAIGSVLLWAPVSAFVWQTPTPRALVLLVAGSLCAMAGDFMASWAARRAPVGLLAPIEYVQIPAAALIGLLAFAETPGWGLFWGTLVLLAATLYLAQRSQGTG
ncbi:DMT family transporter [Roseomonas sp. BU-1]|uniref:DMT family transporter n=2 Tax=Falsiroseomonas selenitidurans TaxID=2716335 RepID=A0ABX1E0P8_9PROT|nr:DMT family transporter [Falsiroseomonas selenitidurans]